MTRKTNWKKIIIYGLAIGYLLLPIDLIPDVPVVGLIDDAIALIIAYFFVEKNFC